MLVSPLLGSIDRLSYLSFRHIHFEAVCPRAAKVGVRFKHDISYFFGDSQAQNGKTFVSSSVSHESAFLEIDGDTRVKVSSARPSCDSRPSRRPREGKVAISEG